METIHTALNNAAPCPKCGAEVNAEMWAKVHPAGTYVVFPGWDWAEEARDAWMTHIRLRFKCSKCSCGMDVARVVYTKEADVQAAIDQVKKEALDGWAGKEPDFERLIVYMGDK